MAAKKLTKALLWNVGEQRVESLHEDTEAAELAKQRYIDKSGSNQDYVDLDIAEFTVRAPEPTYADDSADEKKKDDK